MISMIALTLGLCFAVITLLVVKGRHKPSIGRRDDSLTELEEVLRTAQATHNSFFQSLELVQKNLESLLARAERAEQRMRNLMLQPGGEKREQYTACALLLNEGQEPHRVAAMLNLPLAQVEIVQQLHRVAVQEKKPAQRKRRSKEDRVGGEIPGPTKIACHRENNSQPMLLVDLLKKAAHENIVRGATQARFVHPNAQ